MHRNPVSDIIDFLLQTAWTTAVFWLLVLASIAIAVYAFRTARAAQPQACQQLGLSFPDRLHVVAAKPMEAAAVLHRPPRAAVWRHRPSIGSA